MGFLLLIKTFQLSKIESLLTVFMTSAKIIGILTGFLIFPSQTFISSFTQLIKDRVIYSASFQENVR